MRRWAVLGTALLVASCTASGPTPVPAPEPRSNQNNLLFLGVVVVIITVMNFIFWGGSGDQATIDPATGRQVNQSAPWE